MSTRWTLRAAAFALSAAAALTSVGCQSKGGWWSNPNRTETDYSVGKNAARNKDNGNTGTGSSAQQPQQQQAPAPPTSTAPPAPDQQRPDENTVAPDENGATPKPIAPRP
jgi:hypothetical protein